MPSAESSIVHRINRERIVVLGWSRAILLQIAHPLIAAGVTQHSSFRGGVVQAVVRLHHTVAAMLSLMFGDARARTAAVARIRTIHRSVNGSLAERVGPFAAGTRYSAEDPALLLWVHATLIDSSADIYERIVEPLTTAERDTLCREAAPLLHELGGDPATTPMTWADLRIYLEQMYASGALTVSPDARMLAHAVLMPRAGGMTIPLSRTQAALTAGLLPAQIREAYGLTWSVAEQRTFERHLNRLRALRRHAPGRLAHWRASRL